MNVCARACVRWLGGGMADVNEFNNNLIVVCVSVCTRLSSCVIPSFVVFVSLYSPCVFFSPSVSRCFCARFGCF